MKHDLIKHEKALRNYIFFTKHKWPHFDLLFSDMKRLSKKYKKKKVLFLERTNLYGGISLFGPYFENSEFTSIDCITSNIIKSGQYNKPLTLSDDIIKVKSKKKCHYKKIQIKENSFDCIIIPNLMHHISDPEILISQSKNILKKGGELYIFEPLVRELHQIPEDYGRFSPHRFKALLERYRFRNFKYKTTGGPFTCISYYWDQALQYLPNSKRKKYQKWLKKENLKLLEMDLKYPINKIRKNSSSPMAFSIIVNR